MSFSRIGHDFSQDDAVFIIVFAHTVVDFAADAGNVFDVVFFWRHVDVAANVQAGVARRDAQVVRVIAGIPFVDNFIQNVADVVDFVDICAERIHVDVDFHVVFILQFIFQYVQRGVDFSQVSLIRDFGVDGTEHAARTVVVDADVVDADDVFTFQGRIDDAPDEFRIRRFAQENIDDVLGDAVAGVHDHQANGRAGSGVDGQGRKLLGNGSDQDACRGDSIGNAVSSCRVVDARIDFFANITIIDTHPDFDGDGNDENAEAPIGEFHFFRFKEFFNRCFTQFVTDDEDDDGNGQRRQVFKAAVAEGMFLVWRPVAQFSTDDGNERRAHVRQVIEGIG